MFEGLVQLYLNEFMSKGEPVLKSIINCSVPSKILLEKYDKFKTEDKIESLPEDKKKELWEYGKDLLPNGNTNERLNVCKIIHTIGTLL